MPVVVFVDRARAHAHTPKQGPVGKNQYRRFAPRRGDGRRDGGVGKFVSHAGGRLGVTARCRQYSAHHHKLRGSVRPTEDNFLPSAQIGRFLSKTRRRVKLFG